MFPMPIRLRNFFFKLSTQLGGTADPEGRSILTESNSAGSTLSKMSNSANCTILWAPSATLTGFNSTITSRRSLFENPFPNNYNEIKIDEVKGDELTTFPLFQSISMAIQWGNAACVIETAPSLDGLYILILWCLCVT